MQRTSKDMTHHVSASAWIFVCPHERDMHSSTLGLPPTTRDEWQPLMVKLKATAPDGEAGRVNGMVTLY